MLLSKAVVKQILRLPPNSTALEDLITKTPDDKKPLMAIGDSIVKASLEYYLGLKSPAIPPQQNIVYVTGKNP
jgi:hypothetical protein